MAAAEANRSSRVLGHRRASLPRLSPAGQSCPHARAARSGSGVSAKLLCPSPRRSTTCSNARSSGEHLVEDASRACRCRRGRRRAWPETCSGVGHVPGRAEDRRSRRCARSFAGRRRRPRSPRQRRVPDRSRSFTREAPRVYDRGPRGAHVSIRFCGFPDVAVNEALLRASPRGRAHVFDRDARRLDLPSRDRADARSARPASRPRSSSIARKTLPVERLFRSRRI